MAAASTIIPMEPREIDFSDYCYISFLFQTFLVSGGWSPYQEELSSTELLLETGSAWLTAGELPSPRVNLQGTNIDNKILMTGKTRSSNIENKIS